MKSTQGLGLVEVLIALAIVSIGVVAALQLFPVGLQQSKIASQRTIAAELAETQLAKIRTASSEAFMRSHTQYGSSFLAANDLYTSASTSLTRLPGAGDTYLQRAVFTVQLPDGNVETFVTYVSKQ